MRINHGIHFITNTAADMADQFMIQYSYLNTIFEFEEIRGEINCRGINVTCCYHAVCFYKVGR